MEKLKDMSEEKRSNIYFVIIELIFICISLSFIFIVKDSLLLGSLKKFNNDDVKYIRSAWNLIDSKMLSYENIKEPTVYIMPGLTFVLSFFMIVFGKVNGIFAFKIFQVVLQAASLYLLFLIGKKVFNSRAALAACLMDALYGAELYASNAILMEATFKFLLLALVYISICAAQKKSLKLYAFGGIVLAAACLYRPTIAAYPILILIMWIKKKYSFKEMLKYSATVTAVFCIVMAPWWIRNYKDFSMFIPFTKSAGNPFLQGTFINYDQSAGLGVPHIAGGNSLESNHNEINEGLQRLKIYGKREPLKYIIWYTLGKTFYFWRAPFYWVNNMSYIPVIAYHYIILLYAVKSLIKYRNKNMNFVFLIMVVVYFNIVYSIYFTFERYSYPLMPLIILFAAYAASDKASTRKFSLGMLK